MKREELIDFLIFAHKMGYSLNFNSNRNEIADAYIEVKKALLPPAEGVEKLKQALCDDIQKSLNDVKLYRIYDSEQNSLPLVDYLSAGSPVNTIAAGKREIENIVEQIYFDMEEWQSLAALPRQSQPTSEGVEDDGMMFTISEDGINPLDDEPTAEGAEEILAKGKVLMFGHVIVDPIMLPAGIYATKELRIYLPETTIEHLMETGKSFRDKTQTRWLPDSYFDNLSKCELIDVDVVRDATLHTQKIADKMVEERLREELIKYDKYIGSRGWIDNYEDWAAITSVDEYLKQRQP